MKYMLNMNIYENILRTIFSKILIPLENSINILISNWHINHVILYSILSTYHLCTYTYVSYISFKNRGAGILVRLERHAESINSPHARRVVTRAIMRSSWLWETTMKNEIVECCTDGWREAATILSVRPRSNQLKARGSAEIYAGKINKSDVSLPALGRLLASLLSFPPSPASRGY